MPKLVRLLVLISLAGLTGCSTLFPGRDSAGLNYRREMQAQAVRESAEPSDSDAVEQTAESLIAEGDRKLAEGDRRMALLNYLQGIFQS